MGKTTVLDAVSERLRAAGAPFAALDLDALAVAYPAAPGDDRFRSQLMFRNLAAVWRNFQEYGAKRLVCAYVVESRAELDRYRAAIPGAAISIARLHASEATLRARLARRLTLPDRGGDPVRPEELARRERWQARSRELAGLMELARIEDVLVDTEDRDVDAIAGDVLRGAGWPGA